MGLGLVGCGGACVGKHVGGCRPVGAKIGATERVGSGRRAVATQTPTTTTWAVSCIAFDVAVEGRRGREKAGSGNGYPRSHGSAQCEPF